VYKINTGKFKTSTINIFFHDNLSKENATRNALFPAVLRRGSGRYPTYRDIALKLEELYGASFDCGTAKKGERQIIQFYMEFLSDRYIADSDGLFNKALSLLMDIVYNPVLEGGAFKSEYVEQEKENLKRLIEGRINDKGQYAVERCFEEMYRDEPYSVYEYGSVEDLARINGQNLYSYYRDCIARLPVSVYITGSVDDDKVQNMIGMLSDVRRSDIKQISPNIVKEAAAEVRNIDEKMDVSQGKLSLGFRTGIAPQNRDYYSLVVYNGILGGGIHSKLFQNVREKASLAYYVFSRLEKFKGLMLVSSGIEFQNRNKAVDIILKQMNEIKSGKISDYEFESTVKTIETGINSLKDNQLHIVDFYLSQCISGTDDDFDSFIKKIKAVGRQDVVDAAERIRLDTVYFLTAGNG
jgi:predicted Zn-dependent peptidase